MSASHRTTVPILSILAAALLLVPTRADSQQTQDPGDLPSIAIEPESSVLTEHTVTIRGERVPYTATAGTLPVYDEGGEAVATLFYVYYERSDVTDRTARPLTISFNGGPGSSSVWMHIGYTGPRKLLIDDEGFPVQPYGFTENPHSILDVTDIVYVDPVNTGFARILGDADPERFFGVNQDIAYLAGWIERFVTRHRRWDSPKFLIGESYGTTRVSGLAGRLQGSHRMFLNGVVLVSPTGLGIERDGPVGRALTLPHYAATAWYHRQLDPDLQEKDLLEILPEVESFTVEEYIPALVRAGSLDAAGRGEIAGRVARYAGVSERYVLQNNLAMPISRWRKELMRDQRLTVGRLDARYRGRDRDAAGESYEYDPAMAAWNHAFTPAINIYLREGLGYETKLSYNIFGPVSPWDREGDSTGEDLRQAMAENPFLKLMVQSGYYDGGCDYFSAQYTLWQMDPSAELRDRIRYHAYRSGHMMYLRSEDLPDATDHIRDFIRWSTPQPGERAGWQ